MIRKRDCSVEKNKKAQMKLSFGMIFSIILIIVFVAFAFFAVQRFLGLGDAARVAQFTNNFQSDIDKIWQAAQGSQQEEYFLPSKIKYVCFIDYNSDVRGRNMNFYNELELAYTGSENMFFYPFGAVKSSAAEIRHLDIFSITQNENPFCIENTDGKIRLVLKKDFGENLVVISR